MRLDAALGRVEAVLGAQAAAHAEIAKKDEGSAVHAAQLAEQLAAAEADREALKSRQTQAEHRLDAAIGRLRALVEA